MSFAVMAILLPFLAAPLLGLFGAPMAGARANLLLTIMIFLLTLVVGFSPGLGLVSADQLGMLFGVLSGFTGLATAVANLALVRSAPAWMTVRACRLHHAMCQLLLGCILLGLYTDNILLLWVAVEAGIIAAVVAVCLPNTATARAAAWNSLLLGGAGLALALLGTLLLYLAAQPALGLGLPAMSFAALGAKAAHLDGRLLNLAFMFLLFGYGAAAALAPLNDYLGILLLNVVLLAILRFRHLLQANFTAGGAALPPAPFLLAWGLALLLVTVFLLRARRRNLRRLFRSSAIFHSGIAVFAFGIGGATAIFAGLLHMLLHTLVKSALFQALTRGANLRGRLAGGGKNLGWALAAGTFALTGLPPSGLFTSEFLLIGQAVQRQPVLSLPLGFLLLLYAIAIIRTINPPVFSAPPAAMFKPGAGILVIWLQLGLMLLLAFAMPLALVHTLSAIAASLQ